MDGDHPFQSRCVVSFSFTKCSGLHVSLRLLSLFRVMNMCSKKENPVIVNHGLDSLQRELSRQVALV